MIEFLSGAAVLASLAVVAVHEILKFKIIPMQFANKYPVPTLIILSILAAIGVTWTSDVQPHVWTEWVLLVSTIGVVAAITYNMVFKNWSELRKMEG
jgi:hypothetical protein